nr:unnamed protein product [Digitaria exilis]
MRRPTPDHAIRIAVLLRAKLEPKVTAPRPGSVQGCGVASCQGSPRCPLPGLVSKVVARIRASSSARFRRRRLPPPPLRFHRWRLPPPPPRFHRRLRSPFAPRPCRIGLPCSAFLKFARFILGKKVEFFNLVVHRCPVPAGRQ